MIELISLYGIFMVVGTAISPKRLKVLAGRPSGRDDYIMRSLGITEKEIYSVRNSGNLAVAAEEAARLIYDKTGNPSDITSINIAAIVYNRWRNPKSCADTISRLVLGRKYGNRADDIEASYGLRPPAIALLVADITNEELPFLYERSEGLKFSPSLDDWKRRVRLPVDLDDEVCEYLGIAFCDAVPNGSREDTTTLVFEGNTGDFEFYEKFLSPAIRRLHNIPAPVRPAEKEKLDGSGTCTYPTIRITSRAAWTWIRGTHRFPMRKKRGRNGNIALPRTLKRKYQKRAFINGVIAAKASVPRGPLKRAVINDSDSVFIEDLKRMSKAAGYDPKVKAKRDFWPSTGEVTMYTLTYYKKDFEEMDLLNPKHRFSENH